MGVINSSLVEGGVFSEEVNKKEVTVKGVNSNKKSVRITIILHTLFAIISLLLYVVSYTVLCDLKITFLYRMFTLLQQFFIARPYNTRLDKANYAYSRNEK